MSQIAHSWFRLRLRGLHLMSSRHQANCPRKKDTQDGNPYPSLASALRETGFAPQWGSTVKLVLVAETHEICNHRCVQGRDAHPLNLMSSAVSKGEMPPPPPHVLPPLGGGKCVPQVMRVGELNPILVSRNPWKSWPYTLPEQHSRAGPFDRS